MGDKVGRDLSGKDPSCLMKGLGIYSVGGGSLGRTVSRNRGFGRSETRGREGGQCSG